MIHLCRVENKSCRITYIVGPYFYVWQNLEGYVVLINIHLFNLDLMLGIAYEQHTC